MCEHGKTMSVMIAGQMQGIDSCIETLVRNLNDRGVATVASCCGHGQTHGVISLKDGRELVIMSIDERERHFKQFSHTIHGELKDAAPSGEPEREALEGLDDGPGLISCSRTGCEWDQRPIDKGAVWPCQDFRDGNGCPGLIVPTDAILGSQDDE